MASWLISWHIKLIEGTEVGGGMGLWKRWRESESLRMEMLIKTRMLLKKEFYGKARRWESDDMGGMIVG